VFRDGAGVGEEATDPDRIDRLVDRVRERHATELDEYLALVEEIAAESSLSLPALAVAVRELEGVRA
jgi:hypothetical protein